jgi:hypothetical protein
LSFLEFTALRSWLDLGSVTDDTNAPDRFCYTSPQ